MDIEAGAASVVLGPPVAKSYRPPRRRPAYLRTKTGCLTCRKRKKKCDETGAQCSNCVKRRLNCIWQLDAPIPPQPDIRSLSTSDSGRSCHSATRIPAGEEAKLAHYGSYNTLVGLSEEAGDNNRPRALLLRLANPEEGSRISTCTKPYSPSSLVVPTTSLHGLSLKIDLPRSPANSRRSRPLFQFLISTFLPQLIRPTADGHMSEELTRQTLVLAFEHPFCMHALLACCGSEIPSENPDHRELARFHYTHAVTGLRKILDDRDIRSGWVVKMLGIMMLCIYERSMPKPSPGVSIHLVGAAKLIRLHSQAHEDATQSPGIDQAMHRLARESFIFHVTTSLPFRDEVAIVNPPLSAAGACQFEIDSALSLAEEAIREHFHVDMFSYPHSPVLGFSPQLFRCIHTVYRLYQTSNSDQVSMQLCQRLDNDLCRWDARLEASFTEPLRVDLGTTKGNETPTATVQHRQSQGLDQSTLIGPRLYILGCRVLLQRMIGAGLPAPVDMGADESTHQGMKLIRQLQPRRDYFADYYCWPLLVIGMNLRSSCDRDLLLTQALEFWRATNNPTMRRLIDMLPVYWQSHDSIPV